MAWVHIDDEKAEALQDKLSPEDIISDSEMSGEPEEEEERKPFRWEPRSEAEIYGTKNRWIAMVLAWLLGGLGAHKYYMGYHRQGLILLGFTIAGALLVQVHPIFVNLSSGAWFLSFIEGVIYIFRGKEGFYYTYEKGYRAWF